MLGRSRRVVRRLWRRPRAQRSGTRRKRSRGTPPNVVGKGPLLAASGLRLGVVVIIKDEAPNLEEWLAYHHALGVGHFFVYDNGSTDELHEVIEPWVNHGLVTLVHWPLPGGQIDAYSHALRFYGPSTDWLAFFDVDEFVVPLQDDDIPSLLERWPDAADVRIPRVDFGFSGHRTPPRQLTIEAYTQVADVFSRDPAKPPRVKTIVQPRGVSAIGIHTATLADTPTSADGRPVPTETAGKAVRGVAQLNHYYTRSFEEFEAKRVRGSATGRIDRPAIPFDLPALREDRSALRFAERTRAMLERLHSLEPSPYHYGSQLSLAQFPHFNDLGLFTEFAVANSVAGEPELRREPGLRLPNLYRATGFIGDVSAQGHAPWRGELSESIHMAPLLGRTRGRIETSWAADPASVEATVTQGRLTEVDAGWSLGAGPTGSKTGADDVAARVTLPIDDGGRRRCYALGLVATTPGPVRLRLELERQDEDGLGMDDGGRGPVDVDLDHAASYAGVVEFDAHPGLVTQASVSLMPGDAAITLHDLFIMSYG